KSSRYKNLRVSLNAVAECSAYDLLRSVLKGALLAFRLTKRRIKNMNSTLLISGPAIKVLPKV
ncbi:MAG: hypothetical protein QXL70_00985, partial [Metallosphaera sp.]